MATYERELRRINNVWPIAREGLPFILFGLLLTVVFLALHLLILGILAALVSLFTINFFRDPERRSPAQEKAVLAPADGRILDIRHVDAGNHPLNKPGVKVSVFMNIFNVHVNRVPVSGKVSDVAYHPGKFFSADLDKASEKNERNAITVETLDGREIVFIQIAGLIARRIACWVSEGDQVLSGQRFGLIRFGSRLGLYLPEDLRIVAQSRQKVRAGETILGYLP